MKPIRAYFQEYYKSTPIFGPNTFRFHGKRRFIYSQVFYAYTIRFNKLTRIFLFLSAPFLWYYKGTRSIYILLTRRGKQFKKATGISITEQFRNLAYLVFFLSTPPYYYYYLRLYTKQYSIGNNFLLNRHIGLVCSNLLGTWENRTALKNKVEFEKRLQIISSSLAKNLLVLSNSNILELIELSQEKKTDLFLKPVEGGSGKDCYILEYQSNGGPSLRAAKGSLDFKQTLTFLENRTRKKEYLIQEKLENHRSISCLTNGSMTSCRINTYFNSDNTSSVLSAIFLMPAGNMIVSNAVRGGLVSAVDIETGKIGSAIFLRNHSKPIDKHPDGGGTITGTRLPFWDKVIPICLEAHKYFCETPFIGWDIALTSNGPILLEGNADWSIELWQLTHKETFDADKFIDLLYSNLRKGSKRKSARASKLAF